MTTIPLLPVLSRTSPTFKADLDAAFLTGFNSAINGFNTVAGEVEADAATAASGAATATTQAALATTNGATQVTLAADQVALATTQAGLASTNGAAQVTLATTQAGNAAASASTATAQAGIATTQATASGVSAAASEASRIAASKLNLGSKASAPALDNQGAALLAGATYYDTTLNKWRVWTGAAWGDGISAIAGVASVNGMTGNVVLPPVQTLAYTSRATLRSQTPAAGEQAIVDGLGLFVFTLASTEPDDDESAFATATGVWLLQAAHWDLVDAWQLPEVEERDAYDEDEPLRFAASFAAKVITGTANCAITSVANVSSTSFTGTVTGAAPGDRVIATPPAELGATSVETGRLSYHAFVSAANTVTIMLTNASGGTANTNPAIRTAWPITVIKP